MKGIAIGPILFVIAILAVLVSALASGSGGFNSGSSAEKAKVQASQIIQQANLIKGAVDRVRTNGCTDTEISFENPVVSGYANPNAPLATMPWCNVFHPQGGGITWPQFSILPAGHSAKIVSGNRVQGLSTNAGLEFLITIPHSAATLALCQEINNILSVPNQSDGSLPTDNNVTSGATYKFTGTYPAPNTAVGDEAGGVPIRGKTQFCFNEVPETFYVLYFVLVQR